MKRLMVLFLLVGCGASQGDGPEQTAGSGTGSAAGAAVTESTGEAKSGATAAVGEVPPAPPAQPKLDKPLERRLFPQKFSASSYLENDWNKFQENYLADYLGDDNPVTSWTEGKPDVGLGETVTIEHTPLEDATKLRLEIRNGYQKTPRLFTRNARAKDITIKLLPSGATSKHTLKDAEGWQSLSVEQAKGPLKGYEIQFDSVYKGSHYADLVVSDIQTYVTAFTQDNPTFEASKQKRLLDWVEGRKLAAQTFKDAAKGSIPVAPTYVAKAASKSQEYGEECMENCPLPFAGAGQKLGLDEALVATLEAAVTDGFKSWKQVTITVADKRRIPQADAFNFPGIWESSAIFHEGDMPAITLPMPGQLAYFSSLGLKRIYVEKSPVQAASVLKSSAPGCKQEDASANFFFTPTDSGPLKLLLIASCGLYEDREGYTSGTYWQILSYGDDGQLRYLFDFHTAYAYSWETRNGAPFLKQVARVSTAGAPDTNFVAK